MRIRYIETSLISEQEVKSIRPLPINSDILRCTMPNDRSFYVKLRDLLEIIA